jgi:hypothetical protein
MLIPNGPLLPLAPSLILAGRAGPGRRRRGEGDLGASFPLGMGPFGLPAFDAHGIVPVAYAAFGFALGVAAGLLFRRTLPAMAVTLVVFAAVQTNEAGRCALLLPVLASLPQPLALLEVGTAAGLALYPDRYSYRYGGHLLGSSGPVLDCALTGTAPPTRLPEVAWRAGLDLNPLDIRNPGDLAWLEALIWPEHSHRRDRLHAAAAIAAAHPPMLTRGDLTEDLLPLAARAPAGATLAVFHTSVLYQVPQARRAAFADLVRELPGHWIAVEGPDVLTYEGLPPPPDQALHNVLALDGTPLAWTRAHGQAMAWFA